MSDAEHRARTIDARWTSIARLVATTTTVWEPRYRAKGVTLTSTAAADLPDVWADPERLGQVLANLLENGLRHTPSGGTVVIGARATHDGVTVVVSDTGDGVLPEHLPHLFDRFYRVDAARDRVHGGAGIGLAIAKALVDGHGGSIKADSQGLGQGTTFTVSLPRGVESGSSPVASLQDSTYLVG